MYCFYVLDEIATQHATEGARELGVVDQVKCTLGYSQALFVMLGVSVTVRIRDFD